MIGPDESEQLELPDEYKWKLKGDGEEVPLQEAT